MLSDHPPIFGIEELAKLLKKKLNVAKLDRSRRPNTLPPACVPDGTQKPLWVLEDVIAWLRKSQELPRRGKPKIGAPTKAVRVKKRKEVV